MSELNKELKNKPTPTKVLEVEPQVVVKSTQTLEKDSTLAARREPPKKQPKLQTQTKPEKKNVPELDQLAEKIKVLADKKLPKTQNSLTLDLKKVKEYRKNLETQLKKEAKMAFTPQEKAKLRRKARTLRNQLNLTEVKLSKQQDHLNSAKEVKPLYSPETGTFVRQELKHGQVQARQDFQDKPIQLDSAVLTTQQVAPTPSPLLKRKSKTKEDELKHDQAPPHWQQSAIEKNLEGRHYNSVSKIKK